MKYAYNITFYYFLKGSLACQEGGRQTNYLLREEKSKIKIITYSQREEQKGEETKT